MLETALASGVCSFGGRVFLSGPLPTPAIAHLTHSMRAHAGVVVSASHNSYEDNGIKIFSGDGCKLPDSDEYNIEQLMSDEALNRERPLDDGVGRAERLDDAWGRYVAAVKVAFPRELTLDGVRIVVDAANGAAYRAAPAVFRELGAEVFSIGVQPNGTNINEGCGATHPEACAKEVFERRADVGVTLDGDADRVIMIDEKGCEVDGDAILALCGTRMLRTETLRGGAVVATVMSNLGLERSIASAGGKVLRCGVGDRYVVETMRQFGCNLGGEASGHLIFLDHSTTGDGLIAALQVLAILVRERRPLSELVSRCIERVPQVLLNVGYSAKMPLDEMKMTSAAIASGESALNGKGRILVRWSGTEPKLRILVEGDDRNEISKIAQQIAEASQRDINKTANGTTTRSEQLVV